MRSRIEVVNAMDSAGHRALTPPWKPAVAGGATMPTYFDSSGVDFMGIGRHAEGDPAGVVLGGCEHRAQVLSVCRSRPGQKWSSNGRIVSASEAVGPQAGGFGDRGGTDRFGD